MGRPFSLLPTVTASPKFGVPQVFGGLLSGSNHLQEALGWEAGRQGDSLESGRTLGDTGRSSGVSTDEGPEASISTSLLLGWAPSVGVILGPALGTGPAQGVQEMRAADSQAFRVHPAHPQACGPSEGQPEAWAPGRKSVWDRRGRRQSGEGWPQWRGGLQLFSNRDRRSSLLLLGRSGGSRYERSSSGFVSSGRSWKRMKSR